MPTAVSVDKVCPDCFSLTERIVIVQNPYVTQKANRENERYDGRMDASKYDVDPAM